MRRTLFAVTLLTISVPAAAQVVEVGIGISRRCIGDWKLSTTEVFLATGYRFGR